MLGTLVASFSKNIPAGLFVCAACALACSGPNVSTRPSATNPSRATPPATTGAPAEEGSKADGETGAPHETPAFFGSLMQRAQALVTQPSRPARKAQLPPGLRDIHYDAFRSIRFRPERSLWRNEPGEFEAQFFHPGFYFQETVDIAVVSDGRDSPVPFSTELFSYEGVPAPTRNTGLGFTGFRLHAPLNSTSYRDELIVFLGASYFRPLGKGNAYGLSARGLALDLGEPGPEEFPRFTEFYLVRPAAGEHHVWVLALLESQRATGAYAFRIEPGQTSRIEVTAQLFFRHDVSVVGLAPLTSMYLFGKDAPNRFGDFRPEVHDSDALLIWTREGEWLHRPLRNPPRSTVSSFRADQLRGFGLAQTERDFRNYQDLEARYQARPSAWVEPLEGFGDGSVRLLEIATELETDDNIALAFVPNGPSEPELRVRYRLHVGSALPASPNTARVVATRTTKAKQGTRFLVDFTGGRLGSHAQVTPVVTLRGGKVIEQHAEHNPFEPGFRASFEVAPDPGARDVELRAFLKAGDEVLTETWTYLWQPNP